MPGGNISGSSLKYFDRDNCVVPADRNGCSSKTRWKIGVAAHSFPPDNGGAQFVADLGSEDIPESLKELCRSADWILRAHVVSVVPGPILVAQFAHRFHPTMG
jgi:hypothetical protein